MTSGLKPPALMFVVPPVSDGGERERFALVHAFRGVRARGDVERRGAGGRFVARPRRERRRGGVGAAARRGRQRGAFAAEEMDFGVFEGELRVVFKDTRQLPRRADTRFADRLEDRPGDRVFGNQVEGDEAAEGVLVLVGEVDKALQRLRRRQQGRADRDFADLRGVRAEVHARTQRAFFFGEEPFGDRLGGKDVARDVGLERRHGDARLKRRFFMARETDETLRAGGGQVTEVIGLIGPVRMSQRPISPRQGP